MAWNPHPVHRLAWRLTTSAAYIALPTKPAPQQTKHCWPHGCVHVAGTPNHVADCSDGVMNESAACLTTFAVELVSREGLGSLHTPSKSRGPLRLRLPRCVCRLGCVLRWLGGFNRPRGAAAEGICQPVTQAAGEGPHAYMGWRKE